MIDLSIIIVSYNTKDFLEKCIESIGNTVPKSLDYEIIVVDNASTDGTTQEIHQSFDKLRTKLKVIQNEKNLGFSKANNLGIKEAKGKYILFLNPDTIIYPNTLKVMVDFMHLNKDVGAATCRVNLPNGELDDACHRGFPSPRNAFFHFLGFSKLFSKSELFAGYNLGWKDFSTIHEIDACAGAFMMVKKEAGEQVGWWDEDYFWYGEDLDFCYNLKEKGWKIFYVPEVSILHYKGVSGGIKNVSKHLTTASEETKRRATKARFEAMRIFYNKHYKNKYPRLVNSLVYRGISLRERLASI